MGWNARLVLHRARAQTSLLAVVTAVALLATTLLGTFALLLTTSQERMVAVALDRTRAQDREIDVVVSPGEGGPAVLTRAGPFVDELLGDVPASRETWVSSAMYSVRGTADRVQPYVYLASQPQVERSSTLLSGAFPTQDVDDAGRVLVAVPQVTADAYGWSVGTVVDTVVAGRRDDATFVVTGTFRLTGPATAWVRDPLGGAEENAAYPVLGSAGMLSTRAWGPFVTAGPGVLTDGTVRLGTAHLVAHPELGGASADQLSALRSRLDHADQRLTSLTEADDADTRVDTRLTATIDTAVSGLRVTQVTVVVVALLLVVLAVTVLLNAARLLAERRAPEQRLLSSRGGSGRQLLRLAGLEALCVALLTAALAPWLADVLYRALTTAGPMRDSGLHVDPGRPAALWVVCALCALVLAGVLLVPALRPQGTAEGRADRYGALARSGADVALLLLAVVAFRQLRTYRSPVGPGGSIDPVLVVAPALVLLAVSVLTLRLLPLVTRAGERIAARSRSLTSPLAAWELGRRPGRASAAVVLLTLAIGVGTFSLSFLSTWRTSQQDQADLAIGTDVRVTPTDDTIPAAGIVGVPGVELVAPVTLRDATVGTPSTSARGRDGSTTLSATLLAVDTTHAGELLRGRLPGGWAERTRNLRPTTTVDGVPLPGTPRYLVVDLVSDLTAPVPGSLQAWMVLQDPTGERTTVALPTTMLDGDRPDIVLAVPASTPGTSLVAVLVRGTPAATGTPPSADVTMDVQLAHLRTATGPAVAPGAPLPSADELEDVTPVPFTGGHWGTADGSTRAADDAVRLETTIRSGVSYGTPVAVAATTFADPGAGRARVGALVTPDLLGSLGTKVGRTLHLSVAGADVDLAIVGTVPYLPGQPRGSGVLVDSDLLGRQAMTGAFAPPTADEWWLAVPDAQAGDVARTIERAGDGLARTRVDARTDATDGPLRIGVQAALWVVVAAALLLAVAGIAMSATVSVRTRQLELARLQALGAARGALVRSLLLEHVAVAALGLVAGVAVGTFLARAVAPLVTVSPTGGTPVPGVVVLAGWPGQVVLVGTLLALTAVVVAVVTNGLLKHASGELLRLGDDR
ncbi:FtsX-like permease family protein [Cellulomonas sp. McL0617]|uniref:FtsX-like permease family protein n=1 Tax=Cellulomonas sp. McL0617 TaxID=3415675 RepID=UPI003CF1B1C9